MGIRAGRGFAAGVLGVGVLILAGCTGGPTATVAALDTAVMLAAGEAEAKPVTEAITASQGDTVSTDAGGLAEVGFPDGSFLRLGPDSAVEITELGSAEAQRTSIALDIGQTWHNVQELVAEDSLYEVVTPVGVASVRGTVFAITCVEGPSCTFLVLDGEIEVDGMSITPYERITLPEEPEPQVASVDSLDTWITDNIERDAGAEGAVALPDPPLEAASLAGEWAVTGSVTESNTTDAEVGVAFEPATWTITSECETTCGLEIVSSSDWTATADVEGARFTFVRDGVADCISDDTGEVMYPSGYAWERSSDVTVLSAGWVDGVWAATAMSGESVTDWTEVPDAFGIGCRSNHHDGASLTWAYTQELQLARP